MKKHIVLLLSAAILLCACAKEQAKVVGSGQVEVNVTATIPETGSKGTPAHSDGNGTFADQCKLQIWWGDIMVYQKVAPVSDFKAEFKNILLTRNQNYDFLLWADNRDGDFYVTDTLTRVRLKGEYLGANDKRDAFYACRNTTIEDAFSIDLPLYRPFAQLNVFTSDVADYYNQLPSPDDFSKVVPNSYSIGVTVPTEFNVKTGEASNPKALSYTTDIYSPYDVTAEYNKLTMDYFLASKDGDVVSVDFSAKNESAGLNKIEDHWDNVPLKRNYRTNIVGAILTAKGEFKILVMPEWDNPDFYYEYQAHN